MIAKSCASQNCLSLLRFVRLFSCCVIYISVSYIFQLSCHKTAVDVSNSSFTSGLYRGWNTTVSHVHATVNPARKCSPPSSKLWVCFVNVRFTLSFFWVFVFKRVFINTLGPKCRWIHSINICKPLYLDEVKLLQDGTETSIQLSVLLSI